MKSNIGYVLALLFTLASWQTMGEAVNALGGGGGASADFLMTYVVHSAYMLSAPAYAILYAIIYCSGGVQHRPTRRFIATSVLATPLLMMCSYTWYYSLRHTVVSANSAVFQSNVAIVYLLEVLFLGHRPSLKNCGAVALMLCGVVGIALDSEYGRGGTAGNSATTPSAMGYAICVLSTLFYALYEVGFARIANARASLHATPGALPTDDAKADAAADDDADAEGATQPPATLMHAAMNSLLFLAVHGASTLVTMWAPLLALSYTGIEPLQMPDAATLATIGITALCDTVFNAALLFGVAVSSASQMAGGNVLIVPLGFVVDFFVHGAVASVFTVVGSVVIVVGFVCLQPLPERCTRQRCTTPSVGRGTGHSILGSEDDASEKGYDSTSE